MSTAALLAVAALAVVTAFSSGDGSAVTGGDKSTPTAVPPSATAATGAPTATAGKGAVTSADVTIDSCAVDATTKIPRAGLTVTNQGTDTAAYTVQLDLVDGGGTRVAEGAATVAPGCQPSVRSRPALSRRARTSIMSLIVLTCSGERFTARSATLRTPASRKAPSSSSSLAMAVPWSSSKK